MTLSADLKRTLLIALALAVGWWLVALWVRGMDIIPVWHDQRITFARSYDLANPFAVSSFIYPPWAALIFTVFGLLPLPAATLIQVCLYFILLTLVVYKFGGDRRTVLIALTSFIALDATLELNIEWIICLALLVPPLWSGPLLVIKPQIALGYWVSLTRRDLVRAIMVLLVVLLASLLLWGNWLDDYLYAIQLNTLRRAIHAFNLAPLSLLPPPFSLGSILVGLFLMWRAFKRHDPVLSILAWVFFVPYITLYSLLLPLALFALRYPRVALLVNVLMWVIYGGFLAQFILGF